MRLYIKRILVTVYLILCALLSLLHYFYFDNWSFDPDYPRHGHHTNFTSFVIWPEDLSPLENDPNYRSVKSRDRVIDQLKFLDENFSNENSTNFVDPRKIIEIYLPDKIRSWDVLAGRSQFQGCPADNCLIRDDDRSIDQYHAVIFRNFVPKYLNRTSKNWDQIWIFYTLESPYHSYLGRNLENLINWTATYRMDSDIVTPYEKYATYPASTAPRVPVPVATRNVAWGKDKLVAWFVSNCFTNNDRKKYARELGRHITVDIYGSCGTMSCPRSGQNQGLSCSNLLKKRYKFYLSFENSNCRDYITEKFFTNALENDVIPIVMGAPKIDYLRVAPPDSFVHVDDFESPAHLAKYLSKLDNNDTLYNEYFRWKVENRGRFVDTKFWCRLCGMLNKPRKKVYADVARWWHGGREEEICVDRGWRRRASEWYGAPIIMKPLL